jgi:hypothetical protein
LSIHPVLGWTRNLQKAMGVQIKDGSGLGASFDLSGGKVLGFEGDIREYFCDYLEEDKGFVDDGDEEHELELRQAVETYNKSTGYKLRGFTAAELARELTNQAVEDGEIVPPGMLGNAKYLTAMTKTCEKVYQDVFSVRCLPRYGGVHLLDKAFAAHLFTDADGFCGKSTGWPAQELTDEQRHLCMARLRQLMSDKGLVRVRGANAPWDDPTACSPPPPRIYEFRHLLTDEELCNPANDLPIPVAEVANFTRVHKFSDCVAVERRAEALRTELAAKVLAEAGEEAESDAVESCVTGEGGAEVDSKLRRRRQDGNRRAQRLEGEGRTADRSGSPGARPTLEAEDNMGQGAFVCESYLDDWACPHRRGKGGGCEVMEANEADDVDADDGAEEELARLLRAAGISEEGEGGRRETGGAQEDELRDGREEQVANADDSGGKDEEEEAEEEVEEALERLQMLYNVIALGLKKGDPHGTFTGPPARRIAAERLLTDMQQLRIDTYSLQLQRLRQHLQGLADKRLGHGAASNVTSPSSVGDAIVPSPSTLVAQSAGRGAEEFTEEEMEAGWALLNETEAELAAFASRCNLVVNASRFQGLEEGVAAQDTLPQDSV